MSKQHDIVCFELGSAGADWIRIDHLTSSDLDALFQHASAKHLHLKQRGNVIQLRGADRVGVIQLPSGRRIILRSKIPSLALLCWLAYLGEFPPLQLWLPEPSITTGKDLHECIGQLFVNELDRLTRGFLRKDYTQLCSVDTTLRGRLLVSRLCRRLHRLPALPQVRRMRTLNTTYNVVLALALDRIPFLLRGCDADLRRTMSRLRDMWVHIEREVNDVTAAVTEAQWASPPGYRSAIQLARFILVGAAVDPTCGAGGQTFMLSLADIWERSLLKMLTELSQDTNWIVCPPPELIRYWDDSAEKDDKNRWMKADAMLQRDLSRWVFDAKYKRGFGNEGRNDRFQMCAYVIGFEAVRATLVYPTAKQASSKTRILLDTNIGGQQVRIDAVELPMADGPESCKAALFDVCGVNV